jgi:hypothetical protein
MNIISTTVGLSIMGAAAPMVLEMSIAPVVAQKRAQNFGVAETAAVVFAATYEGTLDTPENTETCTPAAREGTENAYSVTCTHGTGKYVQSVTRAFRLAVPDKALNGTDSNTNSREFAFETPTRFSGHQCPQQDAWGVYGYNDQYYEVLGGACTPRDIWNENKYTFSNPDAWLWDANGFNGYGDHPDY